MPMVHLMQRFDINEGFPNTSPQGIEPYIGVSFVLMHENGWIIPLEERGFGNTKNLSTTIVGRLKRLQDRGFEIHGEVHPFYTKPINIEGDMEFYQFLPPSSAELLREHGVNVIYKEAA